MLTLLPSAVCPEIRVRDDPSGTLSPALKDVRVSEKMFFSASRGVVSRVMAASPVMSVSVAVSLLPAALPVRALKTDTDAPFKACMVERLSLFSENVTLFRETSFCAVTMLRPAPSAVKATPAPEKILPSAEPESESRMTASPSCWEPVTEI